MKTKLFLVLALGFLLCLFQMTLCAETLRIFPKEQTLVIEIPATPVESVQTAAKELAEHLQLATGVQPQILTSGTPLPENCFAFRLATLPSPEKELGYNHAWWQQNKNSLVITENDIDASQGTLFAVYEWLDKVLGCRWLWPGDLGRFVPKREFFVVEEGSGIYHPALQCALWRPNVGRLDRWFTQEAFDLFFAEQQRWLTRNRMFNDYSLQHYPHGFEDWYERFGETHPEYFQMLPNGERRPDKMYNNGEPRLISMCVSNPDVVRQVVQDWVTNFNPATPQINLNENDTAGRCCCDNCLAWDDSPIPAETRRAKAKERFDAGDPKWYTELGSLTNRYAKFYMAVLAEADRVAPERHAKIAGLIYANYSDPPSIRMSPRIYQRYCPPMMFPWTQAKMENYMKMWEDWANTGCKILLRPNYTLDGHCFPINYARHFLHCFRFCHQRNMIGVDMDSCTGNFSAMGLTMYSIVRIICHPEMSDEEIFAEYTGAFGKAAPCIMEYQQRLEELTELFGKPSDRPDMYNLEGGNWGGFILRAPYVFTPEAFQELGKILDKAAEAVETEDKLSAERVAWLRLGLTHAQLTAEAQRGFALFQKTSEIRPFGTALTALDEFRRTHEKESLFNLSFVRYLEDINWPSREFVKFQGRAFHPEEPENNLVSPDWKNNIQLGDFTLSAGQQLPLSLSCKAKAASSAYQGVWGRFYQDLNLTPGLYELSVRYKTNPGSEGHPAFWLMGSSTPGLNLGNIHFNAARTEGEEALARCLILVDKEQCGLYLNWLDGIGGMEILDVKLVKGKEQ